MDVTVCFDGPSASWLRPGKNEAASRLLYARSVSPGPVRRLQLRGSRVQLGAQPPNACIAYGISLRPGGSWQARAWRSSRALIASPSIWLWRPEQRPANVRAELSLELPDGMVACLPWTEQDGVFQLGADAFRFDSYAAFGPFSPVRFAHQTIAIEAVKLDPDVPLARASIERWLRHAVEVASTGGSSFPGQRLQVLLASGAPNGEAFGGLSRGGAASVFMRIPTHYDEQKLMSDWVLVHELSHLQLPFVTREDAWLPEGLATYHQEVLRVRAGVQTEKRALSRMLKAMRSAKTQGTGRSLREESRDMHETYAFRAVYWAGAAYFLMADLTLRERTQGHKTLDSVLAAQRRMPEQDHVLTGAELLHRLDAAADVPVFMPLAKTLLDRPFPEVEPVFERMGVREDGGQVVLDDAAPLSAIRRAIFAHPPPAQAPR